MDAAAHWGQALEAWGIPEEILAQAEESPWIHPPELFELPEVIPPSPSHTRAAEALGADASVVDVGCGGGIATFALLPAVRFGFGIDHQAAMLERYRRNGERLGVPVETVVGNWPEVAEQAPRCDVAAAHHVVYNVGAIAPFLEALASHARHRVVVELPSEHPLAPMAPAWRHFWDLERPEGPFPEDLAAVVRELGFTPHLESFEGPLRPEGDLDQAARFLRIRLCLPAAREPEVRAYLATSPPARSRSLVTLWFDVD